MWKYYWKIAYRNLHKKKFLSFVNAIGLTIAMCCSIFILIFIKDELRFDTYHKNAPSIYRIAGQYRHGSSEGRNASALTNYQLAPKLKTAFPQIKKVARIHPFNGLVKHNEDKFLEKNMCFADDELFQIFTFDLSLGNPNNLLSEPYTVVINEDIARKYFKSQNPIGETVEIEGRPYKISGVIKPMPHHSHFNFDLMLSMETAQDVFPTAALTNLSSIFVYTYLLLPEGWSQARLEEALPDFIELHFGDYASRMDFFLQPLLSIHLYSNISDEIQPNGDIKYIYIFACIAVLVMIIACINYTNLTTAFSFSRLKSIGINKVLGANRRQLVNQLLGESILISIASLFLALILVILLLPLFNQWTGKNIHLNIFSDVEILLGMLVFAIAVGIVAGIYPSFAITSIQPVDSLKGKGFYPQRDSSLSLRSLLVIIQFVISITMIISTILVYYQINFMIKKNLGLEPEQVIVIPIQSKSFVQKYSTFKERLLKNPHILNISASSESLTEPIVNWRPYYIEGVNYRDDEIRLHTLIIDYDFFEVLGVSMAEGRAFSREFSSDRQNAYIFNTAALHKLALDSAVGKSIFGLDFSEEGGMFPKQAKIIGVVKDFHNESLKSKIEPLVFSLHSEITIPLKTLYIKIIGSDVNTTLSDIKEVWSEFETAYDFDYTFLDDQYAQLYKSEERIFNLFMLFSGVAIFIACLGVFGLSSFITFNRTKEIGIRKVLGASSFNILWMLSSYLTKLVFIAFLISIPIAYFGLHQWLQDFPYAVTIGILPFFMGGALAMIIALITLSYQSVAITQINPIEVLNNE